jgi:hypothetical protein
MCLQREVLLQIVNNGSSDSWSCGRSGVVRRCFFTHTFWSGTPIGAWDGGFAPGLDPAREDYASFASLSDPDGNSWVLQERGYNG